MKKVDCDFTITEYGEPIVLSGEETEETRKARERIKKMLRNDAEKVMARMKRDKQIFKG